MHLFYGKCLQQEHTPQRWSPRLPPIILGDPAGDRVGAGDFINTRRFKKQKNVETENPSQE